MFKEYGLNIFDFDFYSRRISFFYNKRDTIGTVFGLILTFLYVTITLILFFFYFIKTIRRTEVTSHESTVYSHGYPSININPNLFYVAFGLEHPVSLIRYIDERIYYPEVSFIIQEKENGIFITKKIIKLDIERCDQNKFGENYQNQFTAGELNNSYCLKYFNLTLYGGSKYDQSSFIQIKAYPCVNTSLNKNHCRPQQIIDFYLTSGYFSIIVKDIGLNPLNYTFPIIPILQNLKTNVDKTMCRESLIYLGITEVKTDIGLFSNRIKSENYLQYRNYLQSFYFISETEYHQGKEIFSAQIKLEEYIRVQNREYTKMSEVFSITGGYMQLISTIFALVRLFTKNITIEKKIINKLFNFNLKQRKLLLDIQYKKRLNYKILENSDIQCFIPLEARKPLNLHKKKIIQQNNFKSNNNSIRRYYSPNPENINNINSNIKSNNSNSIGPLIKNKVIKNNSEKNQIYQINKTNSIERNLINHSKTIMLFKNENINNSNIFRIFGKNISNNNNNDKTQNLNDEQIIQKINFKLIDYIFCGKFKKKDANIELFNFGVNFYRSQIDIINIFNLIFLTKSMLIQYENNKDIFNQTIEIPVINNNF